MRMVYVLDAGSMKKKILSNGMKDLRFLEI
jgi:hypothetical protein